MNRFLKISIIAVLMLALAFTIFGFTDQRSQMATGLSCMKVGWNTRSASCGLVASTPQGAQELALQIPFLPILIPNVGWNT